VSLCHIRLLIRLSQEANKYGIQVRLLWCLGLDIVWARGGLVASGQGSGQPTCKDRKVVRECLSLHPGPLMPLIAPNQSESFTCVSTTRGILPRLPLSDFGRLRWRESVYASSNGLKDVMSTWSGTGAGTRKSS
jgi:hypothetical protein